LGIPRKTTFRYLGKENDNVRGVRLPRKVGIWGKLSKHAARINEQGDQTRCGAGVGERKREKPGEAPECH